ncbi:hypothetical protein [Paenibacillus xylanexedens]|uniref:hypothetical protein n=1 Tax=Paenibacillus xylanexedens TaxID=528191 RepID=UPI00119D3C9F|nr:hypothetical protein [Paenibacillus xylanexedens]
MSNTNHLSSGATIEIVSPPNGYFNAGEQYAVQSSTETTVAIHAHGQLFQVAKESTNRVFKQWVPIYCDKCEKVICEVDENTYVANSVRSLCRSCRVRAVVRGVGN